jgi:hypothetical protein
MQVNPTPPIEAGEPDIYCGLKRKAPCENGSSSLGEELGQQPRPWTLTLNGRDPPDKPSRRVGKWTAEEEMYSEHLIMLFQRGGLQDCREHTTLRAYLAEKLACKPMRITKKYATEDYDGTLMYCPDDSQDPSPVYLAALRDNYMHSITKPNTKRSHKKKRSSEYRTAMAADAPSSWLEDGDEDSTLGNNTEDDLDGQLTPEDIEKIIEILH